MSIKSIKTILISCAILLGLSPSIAQTNLKVGDYILGEVTKDNVNIRTGAGTNFPKAYSIFTDWNGKKSKTEVMPAYKGQRFFVKDAGDWWNIETLSTVDGDSPRFISKKFLSPLETELFDTDSITEKQVWGYVEQTEDEEGEMTVIITIVTIYPGRLVLTHNISPWETGVAIGYIIKDKSAVLNQMVVSLAETGNEVAENTPLKVWAQTDTESPYLMTEYGGNANKTFTFDKIEAYYLDLSVIPEQQWIDLAKEMQNSKNYRHIRRYRSDPEAWFLRKDLSKFIRIK